MMFVIQRVLEAEGNFSLDKNKVIKQNKYFRLFATSNTVGLVIQLDFTMVLSR